MDQSWSPVSGSDCRSPGSVQGRQTRQPGPAAAAHSDLQMLLARQYSGGGGEGPGRRGEPGYRAQAGMVIAALVNCSWLGVHYGPSPASAMYSLPAPLL